MNKLGIPISFSPAISPFRTIALTVSLAASLGLAACGSTTTPETENSGSSSASASATKASGNATSAPGSASASAQQSASSSSSEEALPENNQAASALAQATEAKSDAEEVKTTEELYNQIEDTLAKVQPVDTSTAGELSPDGSTAQDSSTATEPTSYVSAETISQLEAITTGSALDQYIAAAAEYAMSGWRVEGSSKVVSTPKVADGEYNGQKAKILEVCLDSSQIKVFDASGTQVNSAQATRTLNIFTLVEDNGEWKIASHDFPNNADC